MNSIVFWRLIYFKKGKSWSLGFFIPSFSTFILRPCDIRKKIACLLAYGWYWLHGKISMSPSGIQGRWKKRLHIFVACIWLWHLHKTIQLLPCGMHPLIYLPFFLVVIVGCLRKKNFFFQTDRPNVACNSETFFM